MSRTVLSLPLLALSVACAPQNAEIVSGEYTAFLAASRSITYQTGDLKLDEFERQYYVDCREFEDARNDEQNEELRLGNGPGEGKGQRVPVCDDDPGNGEWPPTAESWLDQDGFAVVGDKLEPWRGEALITSEGDVQLGFHQRLPGGEDMWFVLVIDPDFQPRTCVPTADGSGVEYAPVDGDWIAEWSKDVADKGGRLFFLNSNAFQMSPQSVNSYVEDPNTSIDEWFFPNEWLAGHAQGEFADDLFALRSAKYGSPAAYASYLESVNNVNEAAAVTYSDLYYWPPDSEVEAVDKAGNRRCQSLEECVDNARADANVISNELGRVLLPGVDRDVDDGLPSFRPHVHDNAWRTPDRSPSGLDGWVEIHSNWVRFDAGSELVKGGAATGEFALVFEGTESASKFFIRANFEVKNFKDDVWSTTYLPPIKFEQNGTDECGMPPE
jgi:hypothetical protein